MKTPKSSLMFIGAGLVFLASHGLVNRIVPRGEAVSAARQLAAEIVSNDPLAIEIGKRILNESSDWTASEMFSRQDEMTASIIAFARAGASH